MGMGSPWLWCCGAARHVVNTLRHGVANDQLAPRLRIRSSRDCYMSLQSEAARRLNDQESQPSLGTRLPRPRASLSRDEEPPEWLQPNSGDLLSDVYFLEQQIARETDDRLRGIYARSTIVMSFATIEAITNDALATIYELLTDSVPAGCAKLPPWSHFKGRSTDRIKSLLRRGAFFRRQRYVLDQIKRTTGRTMDSAPGKGDRAVEEFPERDRAYELRREARPL